MQLQIQRAGPQRILESRTCRLCPGPPAEAIWSRALAWAPAARTGPELRTKGTIQTDGRGAHHRKAQAGQLGKLTPRTQSHPRSPRASDSTGFPRGWRMGAADACHCWAQHGPGFHSQGHYFSQPPFTDGDVKTGRRPSPAQGPRHQYLHLGQRYCRAATKRSRFGKTFLKE